MRIATALIVCLVLTAGTQASFLSGLTDTIGKLGGAVKDTFSAVGSQAATLGMQLLEQLKSQGGQLASQALQSLALNAMNALQGNSAPAPAVKREVDIHKLADEGQEWVENHMEMMKGVLLAAVSKFQEIPDHMHGMSVPEILEEIDNIVKAHNGLADKIVKEMIQGLVEKFATALQQHSHKRGFSDALQSVGKSLASFFQPSTDTLKNLVSGTGTALKQTINTFNNATNPHHQAIVNSTMALAHHGANALAAIKETLSQVMQTTLLNMAPHIQNLVNHGAQALGEAAGNFVQNLANNVQTPQAQ